jgi:hypothetical protein
MRRSAYSLVIGPPVSVLVSNIRPLLALGLWGNGEDIAARFARTLQVSRGDLFVAQRHDWVNEHRTACRNVARQERN